MSEHEAQVDDLRRERDALRAQVERVEALLDEWESSTSDGLGLSVSTAYAVNTVRAALASSEPVTAGPEREYPDRWNGGPHSRACGIRNHDHGLECHRNCPTCVAAYERILDDLRSEGGED